MVRLINTHLTHLSDATRAPQIERLQQIHNSAAMEGEPVCGDVEPTYWQLDQDIPKPTNLSIWMGDFNFEPDSENYTAITGPISDYGGRIINPALMMDARVAAGYAEMEGWSSDVNGRPARLDYIFISTELSGKVKDCWIDEEAQGSDHQPMWLELED